MLFTEENQPKCNPCSKMVKIAVSKEMSCRLIVEKLLDFCSFIIFLFSLSILS